MISREREAGFQSQRESPRSIFVAVAQAKEAFFQDDYLTVEEVLAEDPYPFQAAQCLLNQAKMYGFDANGARERLFESDEEATEEEATAELAAAAVAWFVNHDSVYRQERARREAMNRRSQASGFSLAKAYWLEQLWQRFLGR